MISIVLSAIFAIIFTKLSRFYQFTVFSLCALYPFSFGNLGPIPKVLIVEWLAPLYLLILINQMIPLKGIKEKFTFPRFRGTELFLIAIVLLIISTIASVINNEIIRKSIVDVNTQGVKRVYFSIGVSLVLFFTTILSIYVNYKKIDFYKWIDIVFKVTIVIGLFRIFTYFMDLKIPILVGPFVYNTDAIHRFGGVSHRIGGLTEVVMVGLACLTVMFYYKNKLKLVESSILIVFLFLSGGRTILVGVAFALIAFIMLFYRNKVSYFLSFGFVVMLVLLIFLPGDFIEGQLGRLTAFEGGIEQQDKYRYILYKKHYENFKENPLIGKGVGKHQGIVYHWSPDKEEFIEGNLIGGGHGSYISILGVLGILGLSYFVIFVFGGALNAYIKIRKYFLIKNYLAVISIFVFMILLMKSVYYLTSHSGLNDISLLFLVGVVASVTVVENKLLYEE